MTRNPMRTTLAAAVTSALAGLAGGAASAQPFELVFEYRIDPSTASQILIDDGLAGALVVDRLVGDASQLPLMTTPLSNGTQYEFAFTREIIITERTNGGPDIVAESSVTTVNINDRDAGSGSDDSVAVDKVTVALGDYEIPPLGPATLTTPSLIARGFDASTFDCVCTPTLGELLEAFDPRTIDDGRFNTQDFLLLSQVFPVPTVPERAIVASGEILIVSEPQNAIVPFGTPTVGFTVVADTVTDAPSISYQWRKDGVDLVDGAGLSGAQTPTVTVDAVSGSEGDYDCVLSTFGDVRVTSPAALGFLAPAAQPDCPADQNFDGALTPADFSAWIINYNEGCP